MDSPIGSYWQLRLAELKKALESNHFDVYLADSVEDAGKIALETIIPGLEVKSMSWGGSMTFMATGLYDTLKKDDRFETIDAYEQGLAPAEMLERRRQSMMVDLFITGTNAVTEAGQLVNLDALGNRVAGITWGPKHVILFIGRNKIVENLDDAMFRIKDYAAPVNAMRLKRDTPCTKTGHCAECNSPGRICNTWTITEKSHPKGRIKIVLINADLGF